MQRAVGEIVDRDDVATIGLAGEQDASIHRLIDQMTVDQLAEHHCAGTAIAFRTPLLGTKRTLLQSKIVEQGQHRVEVVEPNFVTAPQKPNFFTHSLSMCSWP